MPTRESTDHLPTVAEVSAEQRARAVRTVASGAVDAADCAALLDMLGLNAAEGVATVPAPRAGTPVMSTVAH